MAVLADLIRFTTPTVGTGTLTVGTAVSPFLTPAGYGAPFNAGTATVFYSIIDFAGRNSETGTGTYTAAGTTLSRTPVTTTNGNALISLSGQAQVMFTAIASGIVNKSGDTGIGALSISDTTLASTNATVGALVVSGGINIGKNIVTNSTGIVQAQFGTLLPTYITNTNPVVGFNLYYDPTAVAWRYGAGSSQYYGGALAFTANTGELDFSVANAPGNENTVASLTMSFHVHQNGTFHIQPTTDSTSITTGSFVCDGGIGIAKTITCGSNINSGSSTQILGSNATIVTSGSSTSAGTLLNAPAAGNPTKWLPYNDNGVTRYIPSW